MPTICHFEIPADDIRRAKDFYTALFGWKIEPVSGPDSSCCSACGMEYWMIGTTNDKGEQGVCGGMMPRQAPSHTITNYIDVPSVDEFAAKVERLGGKVIMPKTPVPGYGYFVCCQDTENNVFALWETDPSAKPAG